MVLRTSLYKNKFVTEFKLFFSKIIKGYVEEKNWRGCVTPFLKLRMNNVELKNVNKSDKLFPDEICDLQKIQR